MRSRGRGCTEGGAWPGRGVPRPALGRDDIQTGLCRQIGAPSGKGGGAFRVDRGGPEGTAWGGLSLVNPPGDLGVAF